LEDQPFHSKIETKIYEDVINAEWAVKLIADDYVARYKSISDEHFRDRYLDFEDVVERILGSLGGAVGKRNHLKGQSIIVAEELRPSTLVELSESSLAGILTEHGGWTSHSFILARESRVPAVTGLSKVFRNLEEGTLAIVDGYSGSAILNPSEKTLRTYKSKSAGGLKQPRSVSNIADVPLETLDRRKIDLYLNADSPALVKDGKKLGAQGVGLYRSETLFNSLNRYPTEDEQFEAYLAMSDAAGDGRVRIRTFDLSVGQLIDRNSIRERNPALGLRATRLALSQPNEIRTQLRAILRASFCRNIDIVITMVAGLSEIRDVKSIIKKEVSNLTKRGVKIGKPKIGAMIEVPSAVLTVKNILEEVDFLCLGTNDLVQYLLAVDRDNEMVAEWFSSLHPAVIGAIKTVISASENAIKTVTICGEIAGSPFYTPILIGLGATDLSMNLNSFQAVRRLIEGIAFEETRDLIKEIETCRTASEVETSLFATINEKWAHLFPKEFLRPVSK
ncbi:MAG: phosphoenolpyruvate--protein phosphotransferase, partial [Blastocatellia bacterium]